MSKLTDYLRALMATRTTPAEASYAASPSSSQTSFNYNGTGFVAPSDGLVYTYFHIAKTPASWGYMTNISNGIEKTLLVPISNVNVQGLIPVSKGQVVRIENNGFESMEPCFIKTMGGGVNRLFRCFKEACYA